MAEKENFWQLLNGETLAESFVTDCAACVGICCTALYFAKEEGFPIDKMAGEPCKYLQKDHRCSVHADLMKKGFHGCVNFDCMGAGQLAAQKAKNEGITAPKTMYDCFFTLMQLRLALFFLWQARLACSSGSLEEQIRCAVEENARLTSMACEELARLDAHGYHQKLTPLLAAAWQAGAAFLGAEPTAAPKDLVGKKPQATRGADFSGSLLLGASLKNRDLCGANFLAADLRGADLCGADLSHSFYLTRGQVQSARTDEKTKLPLYLRQFGA
ncbi:pentapeptide repeat-containing protein [Acidaminobacterium chupaoyuni]